MGVIVRKDTDRDSGLSQRISADLRAKAVATDFTDEEMTEGTSKKYKKTAKTSWFWIALVALAAISAASIILF